MTMSQSTNKCCASGRKAAMIVSTIAAAADAAWAAASTAASAAHASAWAAANKNEFNQKMIDIIEEIVKVKS